MRQLRALAVAAGTGRVPPQLFQSLVVTAPDRDAGRKGATYAISIALHSSFALALAVLPLLLGNTLPATGTIICFPPLPEIAILPPPPAPTGNAQLSLVKHKPKVEPRAGGFVAPVDVSSEIISDSDLLTGSEGNPDGILGGVPDLPRDARVGSVVHVPPPPPKRPAPVVRISTGVAPPQPVVHVAPLYPQLAVNIGLSGAVVVEAEVDTAGRVKAARVLSGHPLLTDAALVAVQQWRYRPLLLNGEPMGFILNVTVEFNIRRL